MSGYLWIGLSWWLSGKESTYNAGITGKAGSIPRSGRSPGGGHGNPLQYSCLENPMDRGAWWATVHRVTKSRAWLKWLSTHAHIYWVGQKVCLHFNKFFGQPNIYTLIFLSLSLSSIINFLNLRWLVYYFTYLFIGLYCGARASDYNGFSYCRAWTPGPWSSVVAERKLNICDTWT